MTPNHSKHEAAPDGGGNDITPSKGTLAQENQTNAETSHRLETANNAPMAAPTNTSER